MKEIGNKDLKKVKESILLMMAHIMMENGKMMKKMDKEFYSTPMEINMMVNGIEEKDLVLEDTFIKMQMFMKANGKVFYLF